MSKIPKNVNHRVSGPVFELGTFQNGKGSYPLDHSMWFSDQMFPFLYPYRDPDIRGQAVNCLPYMFTDVTNT